eukprot:s2435_g16.t1
MAEESDVEKNPWPTALERLMSGGDQNAAPATPTEEPEEPEDEQVSPGAATEAPTMVMPDNLTVVDPQELESRWYNTRLEEVEEEPEEYEIVEEEQTEVKEKTEEKVVPTKSVKRKQQESGMAQPVVPHPSKAARATTLPPLPPPPGPPQPSACLRPQKCHPKKELGGSTKQWSWPTLSRKVNWKKPSNW